MTTKTMICWSAKTVIGKWLSIGSRHELTRDCFATRRLLSSLSTSVTTDDGPIVDVEKYRQQHDIQCFGDRIADPIQSFDSYKWPLKLGQKIKQLEFITPTPIQSQSLPVIFSSRDLVAIASSGSGKTLCFVLPALLRTLIAGLDRWPKCLILSPTRELTHQIQTVVDKFHFARSVCLYGDVSIEVQSMLLKRGNPHIVIATPSRLKTILETGIARLDYVDFIIVDEADLMLRMGLGSDFQYIMNALPAKRQTLMFSATWPQSVQSMADQFLKDYVRVNVGKTRSNQSLTVNKNIEQTIKVCKECDKEKILLDIMNQFVPTISGFIKTIIFVRHKKTADRLVRSLAQDSFPARAVHSNKHQRERDYVIREFRRGTISIIVATDVASRGLDFKDVKLVINYDFPSNLEDYTHRIGRTGRHKEKGRAVTLFTHKNIIHKTSLIELLTEADQKVDPILLNLTPDSEPESGSSTTEDSGYESSGEYESNSDSETNSWSDDEIIRKTNDNDKKVK